MTAAEQEWQPGDPNPLVPDNPCGPFVTPTYDLDETAEARAEDDTPPPWWRPGEGPAEELGLGLASTRACRTCGVRWRGDDPCWNCGGEESP